MTNCQNCAGAAQTYLCSHCTTDLRKQLSGLPTLIGYIQDKSINQTRQGNNGESRKLRYTPYRISGDDCALCGSTAKEREYLPCECVPETVDDQKRHRQLIATARTNTEAARLLDEIHDTLGQWARHIARTHKLAISPPVTWRRPIDEYVWHTSTDFARFLAGRTRELAADQDIGDLPKELHNYILRGEKLINPPIPPKYCGPCPTVITEHSRCKDAKGIQTCSYRNHDCATQLTAKHDAIEVTCFFCKTTHNIEKLIISLLPRADEYRCTIPEMYDVLSMLDERVPMRTLYNWVARRWLLPSGYQQPPDSRGRTRIVLTRNSDDDQPVYRVSDARKLRAEPKMSAEQRKDRASKAAQARWRKDTPA